MVECGAMVEVSGVQFVNDKLLGIASFLDLLEDLFFDHQSWLLNEHVFLCVSQTERVFVDFIPVCVLSLIRVKGHRWTLEYTFYFVVEVCIKVLVSRNRGGWGVVLEGLLERVFRGMLGR